MRLDQLNVINPQRLIIMYQYITAMRGVLRLRARVLAHLHNGKRQKKTRYMYDATINSFME